MFMFGRLKVDDGYTFAFPRGENAISAKPSHAPIDQLTMAVIGALRLST